MKIYFYAYLIVFLAFAFLSKEATAQNRIDSTVNLDVFTVPNSPAFNLLGISPSVVDRPDTPRDFAISLANTTTSGTLLPKNYAVEFLPVSFFSKNKNLYGKFTNDPAYVSNRKQKLWNTVSQTFIISGGFATDDSVKTVIPGYIKTRSGVGFRFSLVRGKIDRSFTDYKLHIDTVRLKLKILHDENQKMLEQYRNTNSVYLKFDAERAALLKEITDAKNNEALSPAEKTKIFDDVKLKLDLLNAKKTLADDHFKDSIAKNEQSILAAAAQLKKQIEQIKFRRYGWMADVAGGLVLGFRNDDFQNSVVQQYAFWFNGGYSAPKGFDFLGIARFTNAVNVVADSEGNLRNEVSYDLGGKIEFHTNDNKFSINGEVINRISPNTSALRYTFNASYQVGGNQALTFSVGKAFAGTAEYGGNLIASLNYIKAFGSKRSLVP